MSSPAIPLAYDYAPMQGTHVQMKAREHALVLVHGMTSAAATFGNVMEELTSVAHVFAVDLRGHGRTAEPPTMSGENTEGFLDAFCIPNMAADVAHFIRTVVFEDKGVAKEVGSVHVLGHSWGARVVSALAADPSSRALVKSLIIEDEVMTALELPAEQATKQLAIGKVARAKGMWKEMHASKEGAVKFCADAMQGDAAAYDRKVMQIGEGDEPFKVLFKPHVAIAWNFHATTFDCTAVWDGSEFKGPVGVIAAGDESGDIVVAKQEHSMLEQASAAKARGLDRRFSTIAGSSHSVHRSHPHEFVHSVRDFVAAVVHNID